MADVTISGNMKIKTLKNNFNKAFGSILRVYNGVKFADDEEAISYHNTLKPLLNIGFAEKSINYGGNIAYIVIGQSLALGIPKKYKKYLSPVSFFLERILTKLPIIPKLFFTAVWEKN